MTSRASDVRLNNDRTMRNHEASATSPQTIDRLRVENTPKPNTRYQIDSVSGCKGIIQYVWRSMPLKGDAKVSNTVVAKVPFVNKLNAGLAKKPSSVPGISVRAVPTVSAK